MLPMHLNWCTIIVNFLTATSGSATATDIFLDNLADGIDLLQLHASPAFKPSAEPRLQDDLSAKSEIEKPLDPRLSRLRTWIRDALRSMGAKPIVSNWSHDDWSAKEQSIEWVIGSGCHDGVSPDCNEVCSQWGFTCDSKPLEQLTTFEEVDTAAKKAGTRCLQAVPIEQDGEWDGPWIDDTAKCGFATGRSKWKPSCSMQPHCSYHRICPCETQAGSVVPSLQRKDMWQWHQQWDQNCERDDVAQRLLKQGIPRHWHFVLILERAQWINASNPSQLITPESREYKDLDAESQLLIENMRYSLALNEAESVHFLDDTGCRHALEKADPRLLPLFEKEVDLRYKSDICRIAALYNEGGYYFDDDMHSYYAVPPILQKDTRFATARGVSPDGREFFQSFMASTACHPILKRNIELLVAARQPDAPKKYEGLLGPVTLRLAWDEVNADHTQLMQEIVASPASGTYEAPPGRNGHRCVFVVVDPSSKKTVFCSRMWEG